MYLATDTGPDSVQLTDQLKAISWNALEISS